MEDAPRDPSVKTFFDRSQKGERLKKAEKNREGNKKSQVNVQNISA
jgi:hypothetical protein